MLLMHGNYCSMLWPIWSCRRHWKVLTLICGEVADKTMKERQTKYNDTIIIYAQHVLFLNDLCTNAYDY